jgi:transcription initiation factor IIF auxiliary subunit
MPDELTIQQWEKYEGEKWWKWAVWIEGRDEALDRIDFVEWALDPTFPNPIRKIHNRASKFRLETGGWGMFPIVARVQLKDGQQTKLSHYLKLHYPDGTETTD